MILHPGRTCRRFPCMSMSMRWVAPFNVFLFYPFCVVFCVCFHSFSSFLLLLFFFLTFVCFFFSGLKPFSFLFHFLLVFWFHRLKCSTLYLGLVHTVFFSPHFPLKNVITIFSTYKCVGFCFFNFPRFYIILTPPTLYKFISFLFSSSVKESWI